MSKSATSHIRAASFFVLTQSTIPWLLIATLALTSFGTVTSQPPAWWSQRGVLDPSAGPNDFGPANLGQLKHVATMARDEFDARLPGGAGATIDALIDAWYDPLTGQALTPNPPDQNLAPINLGQLKAVAKPFYDRLIAENLLPAGAYPWTAATTDDANFSPANIGQLKHIFRFDIPALIVAADPNGDFDGDGIPNGTKGQSLPLLSRDFWSGQNPPSTIIFPFVRMALGETFPALLLCVRLKTRMEKSMKNASRRTPRDSTSAGGTARRISPRARLATSPPRR